MPIKSAVQPNAADTVSSVERSETPVSRLMAPSKQMAKSMSEKGA